MNTDEQKKQLAGSKLERMTHDHVKLAYNFTFRKMNDSYKF
jgi:hypothetical protein